MNVENDKKQKRGKAVSNLSPADHEQLAGFERRCDLIRDRVRSVADRYQNGLYLVGRPGSGKTYTVEETLQDLGARYTCRNCHMTPAGLWEELKEHPDHILVLDDIPVLLRQPQAQQVLLAAMGGRMGEPRLLTYTTKAKDERERLEFRGGVIGISNVPLAREPLANALASRIPVLEHEPPDEELAAVMRQLANQRRADLTPEECREVAEFVIQESQRNDYRLDLRSLDKGLQDRRQHKAGRTRCSWQDLVRSTMRQVCFGLVPRPLTKQEELAEQRECVRQAIRRHPSDRHRQLAESGLSRSTFYKRLREAEQEDRRRPRLAATVR
jgi:hypothetical protein